MPADDFHDRLETLFHEALDLGPGARDDFVRELRDVDVRMADELASLLGVQPEAEDVFARLGQAVPLLDGAPDSTWPPGLLAGRTLSHYRVERLLGTGGMGEVYFATDLALGRPTALKVLKPERAEAASYFRREVATTARLQHPAIATFYEVGEVDAVLFLAMEYVPGSTLREQLGGGALDPTRAIRLVATLLEAISHAHSVGVVHRDIKPENIIVTPEGFPKLMDFGIAKALEPIGTEGPRTATGLILGTLGYMAPEQLRGDAVDHRTDLFAITAVLYELLSGGPAFPGDSPLQRMLAISKSDPAPLGLEPFAGDLDAILAKGLAKDRHERYQTAGALIEDLRALAEGSFSVPASRTLAILGFENREGSVEDAWLGYGLSHGLRATLAEVEGLDLVEEDAVQRRAKSTSDDHAFDPASIGRALGCTWVVSGGYRRVGDELEIDVTVLESSTGTVLLSESLRGAVASIFDLQRRLGRLAAACMTVEAGVEERSSEGRPELAAYELFARSRAALRRGGKGDHRRARELLEQAVQADPSFVDAHASLAQTAAMEFIFNGLSETLDEAVTHATRALELSPDHRLALTWLLYARYRQGRADEAMELAEHVSRIAPSDHSGPYFCGAITLAAGDAGSARPFLQRAVELDERHGMSWAALGWAHLESNSFASARWCLEHAHDLELDEEANFRTGGCGALLAECLRREGALTEARRVAIEALDRAEASDFVYRDTFRAIALCSLGRTALEQGDAEAALAAFTQAEQHLRGRPASLGSGYVLVQAIAGRVRATSMEPSPSEDHAEERSERPGLDVCLQQLDDACLLLEQRSGFNFEVTWGASEGVALLELARSFQAVGQIDDARSLFSRAAEAGCAEARLEPQP